jgi:hypothetical protein
MHTKVPADIRILCSVHFEKLHGNDGATFNGSSRNDERIRISSAFSDPHAVMPVRGNDIDGVHLFPSACRFAKKEREIGWFGRVNMLVDTHSLARPAS